MQYTLYNVNNGEITGELSCPAHALTHQNKEDYEEYFEGSYLASAFKIIDGEAVEKTTVEKTDYLYAKIQDSFPTINNAMSDLELNQTILTFYYSRVDVAVWRVENYKWIRKQFYPDLEDKADAEVKLSSTDPTMQAAGQAQLDKYNADCLAVKTRFPKQ